MNREEKITAKDLMFMALTGGMYVVYIFLKILFTTPAGQKKVEEKINSWMRVNNILVDEEKEDDHEN